MAGMESHVDAIIERHKGQRLGARECNEVVELVVDGALSSLPHAKAKEVVEMLMSAEPPIYLNEVKDHLLANDRDMLRRYADMFVGNPGAFEAFGVRAQPREPPAAENRPKDFRGLRPRLLAPSTKRKAGGLKSAIRKESKASAQRKMMREKAASAEYRRKVDGMYKKMRREK